MSLLDVRGLTTEVRAGGRWHEILSDVSFQLQPGEIVGLVGESGCGKSTTAYSLMRLLPPNVRIAGGEALLDGVDLFKLDEHALRDMRGRQLGMIFQDPTTSLDPAFTVGDQLIETVREHLGLSYGQGKELALELFRQVGIPAPEQRLNAYPHQFSGGMRQRIALAIAISCHPRLLIADEPTTALDVSIQAQILSLIRRLLVEGQGTSVLLITHDLGIVAQVCDRVAVMYAGRIVETGDVISVFSQPLHPYTQALLNSLPTRQVQRGQLMTIPGRVPSITDRPGGCRFHPRCAHAREVCASESPATNHVSAGREVACVLYQP